MAWVSGAGGLAVGQQPDVSGPPASPRGAGDGGSIHS
jgi:hypothetical protein